MLSGAS